MSWTPVLGGRHRDDALRIVRKIAADLGARFGAEGYGPDSIDGTAWSLSGRSGAALFFAYYGTAFSDGDALAFAAQLVEESLDAATGTAGLERLFEGFAGVAWTLAHVDGWLLDVTDGDPNDAIDVALLEAANSFDVRFAEYDLLSGLVGVGVYALERLPRPRASELLEAVVDRLQELAELDAEHPLWWTPAERLPPQIHRTFAGGAWNLGVAHGAPGVIAMLAKAQGTGVVNARPLLGRAADWLMAQRCLPAEAGSMFPEFVAPGVTPHQSRLAWCYGDLGIAGALSVAGRHAGELEWQSAALSVAKHAAARAVSTSGVDAAHICHGSAGVAHIFNRLFQSSGCECLRTTASSWLESAIDSWEPNGVADDPGLLTGSAGVGLVLLAATTPVEPSWDRLLLLS